MTDKTVLWNPTAVLSPGEKTSLGIIQVYGIYPDLGEGSHMSEMASSGELGGD